MKTPAKSSTVTSYCGVAKNKEWPQEFSDHTRITWYIITNYIWPFQMKE